MKILRVILKIIIWLVVIGLLAAVIGILCSQKLTVEEYTEALDGVSGDVKIVFLSDFHGKEFGENDKKVVEKIFNDLAKRYENRNGGYTQILKLTERRGDDALMVIIELV